LGGRALNRKGLRHSRATLMTCCFLESSACLPTSVRISSISHSTSFLASSCPRCCTSSFSCRQSLCRISSHWVVCRVTRQPKSWD
uniref:Uncharacterized protein n=1 Tax=Terrapene triunguis TaxID=2587831 RepID=A0A674IDJ5_9SAUR